MEIFDSLNLYLMQHPIMIEQLEFAFRIKWWCLLLLFFVFLRLVSREDQKKKDKSTSKDDHFIA